MATSPPATPTAAPTPQKSQQKLSFMEDFLLGGTAAAISKTVAAPIERIKLLIQNQNELYRTGRLQQLYSGPIDCLHRTVTTEGVFALWRGNMANVIRYFPTQALNFAFKDVYKQLFRSSDSQISMQNDSFRRWGVNLLTGGLAGVSSLTFVYSLEFAFTRLTTDVASSTSARPRKFNGLFDVYRQTLAADGIRGLYRGFLVSCTGIFVYRGFYFGLFDSIKPYVLKGDLEHSFLAAFFLGWIVDAGAGFVAYPIDTVRRRMMMTSGEAVKYTGSWDAAHKILLQEGYRSFFRGAGTNIVRSIAGAIVLSGFEQLKHYYLILRDGKH